VHQPCAVGVPPRRTSWSCTSRFDRYWAVLNVVIRSRRTNTRGMSRGRSSRCPVGEPANVCALDLSFRGDLGGRRGWRSSMPSASPTQGLAKAERSAIAANERRLRALSPIRHFGDTRSGFCFASTGAHVRLASACRRRPRRRVAGGAGLVRAAASATASRRVPRSRWTRRGQ
jgi:hypothetical protein